MDNQGLYRINTSISSENDLIPPSVEAPSPIQNSARQYPNLAAPPVISAPPTIAMPAADTAPVTAEELRNIAKLEQAETRVKVTSRRLKCTSCVLILFGLIGVIVSFVKYIFSESDAYALMKKVTGQVDML